MVDGGLLRRLRDNKWYRKGAGQETAGSCSNPTQQQGIVRAKLHHARCVDAPAAWVGIGGGSVPNGSEFFCWRW